MRILVLGGSGFLGSHIVDRFLAADHDVTVYDLYPERFRRSPAAIKFHTGDFGNVGALDELISTGFDAVIHCVSTTTPKSSNESPEFDIQSNVIGTLYLLDICVKHKVGKLVFMSSGGTVYGDIGDLDLVDETHAVRPMCSYGRVEADESSITSMSINICADSTMLRCGYLTPMASAKVRCARWAHSRFFYTRRSNAKTSKYGATGASHERLHLRGRCR